MSGERERQTPEQATQNCTLQHNGCAAHALKVQLAEAQAGWISAAERLPEVGQPVLVFWQNAIWLISCARLNAAGVWVVEDVSCQYRTANITHWRPLPAPPAQEVGDDE